MYPWRKTSRGQSVKWLNSIANVVKWIGGAFRAVKYRGRKTTETVSFFRSQVAALLHTGKGVILMEKYHRLC